MPTSESMPSLSVVFEFELVCCSHDDGDLSAPGDDGDGGRRNSFAQWFCSFASIILGTGVDVRSGDATCVASGICAVESFIELSNVAFSLLFILSDWFWSSNDVDGAAELFGLESIGRLDQSRFIVNGWPPLRSFIRDTYLDCDVSMGFDAVAAGTFELWSIWSTEFVSDALFELEFSRCASLDFFSLLFESFGSFVSLLLLLPTQTPPPSFVSLSLGSFSLAFFDGPRRFGGGAFDAHPWQYHLPRGTLINGGM